MPPARRRGQRTEVLQQQGPDAPVVTVQPGAQRRMISAARPADTSDHLTRHRAVEPEEPQVQALLTQPNTFSPPGTIRGHEAEPGDHP